MLKTSQERFTEKFLKINMKEIKELLKTFGKVNGLNFIMKYSIPFTELKENDAFRWFVGFLFEEKGQLSNGWTIDDIPDDVWIELMNEYLNGLTEKMGLRYDFNPKTNAFDLRNLS